MLNFVISKVYLANTDFEGLLSTRKVKKCFSVCSTGISTGTGALGQRAVVAGRSWAGGLGTQVCRCTGSARTWVELPKAALL